MKACEISSQNWWSWCRLAVLIVAIVSAMAVPTLSGGETIPNCPDCLPVDTIEPETTMVLDNGSNDSSIFEVVSLILKILF